MNGLADEIHTNACPDCCYIEGSEKMYYIRKCIDYILLGNDNLLMVASYEVSHLLGILKVNCVSTHTYRKGLDGLF